MRLLRTSLLSAVLAGAPLALIGAGVLVPSDAHASVSIAVAYDALVKDADSVGVVTPVESKSVWEEGRIYSYTRVRVEQGIAGELATGSEGWIRTMGGVVGKIGQLVDGEPVFTPGKSSLVFMRKFKLSGQWEVSARAQGQYPVIVDPAVSDSTKARRVIRSAAVGVLFPAKTTVSEVVSGPPAAGAPAPTATVDATKTRLASEMLHDRPLDEVSRDVAASWKKLHATAPSDTKK